MKIKIHREVVGKIKTVTVRRNATGKYFVSVLINDGWDQVEPLIHFDQVEAIDVGISRFATTSQAEVIENPKFIKKALKNLRRKQKTLSRKAKGSANRNKARIILAKRHENVANARKDFHHKISHKLASENQAVGVEDLNIKGMSRNHKLAQVILDAAGWGQWISFLKYKIERKGGKVVQIDRWFPSSKTCSCCGHKIDAMPLSVRSWRCPKCQTVHDRDLNAAINLRVRQEVV